MAVFKGRFSSLLQKGLWGGRGVGTHGDSVLCPSLSATTIDQSIPAGALGAATEYLQGYRREHQRGGDRSLGLLWFPPAQVWPQLYGVQPRPGRERFTTRPDTSTPLSRGVPAKGKCVGPPNRGPLPCPPAPLSAPHHHPCSLALRRPPHPSGEARAPGGCWRGKGSRLVFFTSSTRGFSQI